MLDVDAVFDIIITFLILALSFASYFHLLFDAVRHADLHILHAAFLRYVDT